MKIRFKKLLTWYNFAAFSLIAAAAALLVYRLGSLVPGFAGIEQQLPSAHESLAAAWNDPIMLPYTLWQMAVAVVVPFNGYGSSRLPAALLGGLILVCMYWLLKQWYGQRLALFGTALLATSPWLLHVARLADSSIMYPLSMTVVLILAALWHKKNRPNILIYASLVIATLLTYVPGMVWLVLLLAIVERKNFIETFKASKKHVALGGLVGLVLLAPLVHSLVVRWQDYAQYLGWAGAHRSLIDYPLEYLQAWQHIFIGGYDNPVFNLGGLPFVSILVALMFGIGVYLYAQHRLAVRTRLLAAWWLVGTALVSLPVDNRSALLLPLVIVLATGGIGYLLHLWLMIFPRNPLARSFGIGLVALLISFGVAYNLRNYFVAWPNNPETRQAFSRKL